MRTPEIIPLKDAQVCLDCEAVSRTQNQCPACGSKCLWPLNAWLTRKSEAA